MLQDIGPHVFRNEFSLKRPPRASDWVMAFRDRNILVSGNGKDVPLRLPEVSSFDKGKLLYLFSADSRACYLYTGDPDALGIPGFSWQSTVTLRSENPRLICFAGFTAWHLHSWYITNRFCGKCGAETAHSENERALFCPRCGNIIYPRIAPAVIVGITDGDRLLITRYRDRPYRGPALIAGFCEIGETPEQTASREAMEEVGIRIRDLTYAGSQPWGLDGNLLMGFMAKADGNTRIIRDENELAEAVWLSREEIPEPDTVISLTRTMISNFKRHGFNFGNGNGITGGN